MKIFNFHDSQCVITGSSRGLGQALALQALGEGAKVIGIARSKTSIENPNYLHIQADLGSLEQLSGLEKKLSAFLEQSCGNLVLVNNAGKVSPIGRTGTLDPAEVIQACNVNFTAMALLTNYFLKLATTGNAQATVANVTSGVAKYPKALWAIYSAAKAGMNAYSEALAKEIAPHRVICFEPGIIDTEMQLEIRSLPEEQFPEVNIFRDFKAHGDLRSPEAVAKVLLLAVQSSKVGASIYHSV